MARLAPALLLPALVAGCVTSPAAMHESFLTLDTHLYTPTFFGIEGWNFGDRHDYAVDGTQIDLPRMIEGGLDGGFFVTFTPQGPLTDEGRAAARAAAHKRLDEIQAMFARYPGRIQIVRTAAEARRIAARGGHFAFLSLENSYPMGLEPESAMREFHQRGVRMASPVHTQHNDLASSSTDDRPRAEPGLTELGRRWVREANRIGMLIDGSHASDATLDDILALSTKPIVLSHSGAKDVFAHPRNVDDMRLRRVAERGGVIQVAAFPDYLVARAPNPERAAAIAQIRRNAAAQRTLESRHETVRRLAEVNQRWSVTPATFEQFMDHLLHVIRVVGIDHVGIGIDFDGGGGVEGLQDATQYPRITERLLKEGYSRSDLAKLWGGNLLRILDQAQKADSTPFIAGVVAAGTPIEIVKEGLDGTEGPLRFTDGSLLFTENRAGRILQVAADGTVSVFLAETNGSNSLALNAANELVSVQTKQPAVGVVHPATSARTLASAFEGRAFIRPNDLVVDRDGGVYFTDPGNMPPAGAPMPGGAVYYFSPSGSLRRLISDIAFPNGIQLSRDERTLYVANTAGESVRAYDLPAAGVVANGRDFAQLAGVRRDEYGRLTGGADGLAIDSAGRLYAATAAGVQVFSPSGQRLGVIPMPRAPQNLAFAGQGRQQLYVVGRGSVYRIAMIAEGFAGRAK